MTAWQGTLRVRWAKNRQERRLPVAPNLHQALERYVMESRPQLARDSDDPALFLSRRGRRMSPERIDQVVRAAARGAGLVPVGAHALRHACATHLLAGGADIRHVQALLGHLHLDSTQRYTHLQPLEVFAEHKRTHPRRQRAACPRRVPPV